MDSMASSSGAIKPEEPDDDEVQIQYLPWLDFKHCSCNCSLHPKVGKVLVNEENVVIYSHAINVQSTSESGSDDSSEEDDQLPTAMDESTCDVLYSEKFKLKGCTFHDHFQIALKEC